MIINEVEAIRKLTLQIEKVMKAKTDLLIFGAAGVGKSTWAKKLAQRLHNSDPLSFEGRDFDFNEFFDQVGQGQGSVILEDVEQLSFSEQSRLLAWMESAGRGFKVVFTTRASLWEMVEKQSFRSDLYYRISVATLRLPDIREMRSDLPALCHHLVGVYKILHNRSDVELGNEALKKILEWSWPGNFSELENVIEKAVLLCEGLEIQESDIETNGRVTLTQSLIPIKKLSEVERDLILQTLKITDQNRTRAAEILGISIRTLRNKIQEYRQEGLI